MTKELMLSRQGWADALIELGEQDPSVVVLDADLAKSTLTCQFGEKFPKRFFDLASQNIRKGKESKGPRCQNSKAGDGSN